MINKLFFAINLVQLIALMALLITGGFSLLWLIGFILGIVMLIFNGYDIMKGDK